MKAIEGVSSSSHAQASSVVIKSQNIITRSTGAIANFLKRVVVSRQNERVTAI